MQEQAEQITEQKSLTNKFLTKNDDEYINGEFGLQDFDEETSINNRIKLANDLESIDGGCKYHGF